MDDPFIDVISVTVQYLDHIGIPYAITGSIASGAHGEPVLSQDVDIAVHMTPEQARTLADELPQRFYRNREHLEEVSRIGGLANLIDSDTGLKVDLSVLERTPYYDGVLTRRTLVAFGPKGPSFFAVTPEDIILMKLLWRRESRSEKQWRDALGVAKVQGTRMDWNYLWDQAEHLQIKHDLTQLRDEAGI